MARFVETLLWEFAQNLPVILCFVAAVWLWAARKVAWAVGCALAGALAGALVIRFTEVTASGREPLSVTLVNVVLFGVLLVAFAAYLGTERRWSSWRTDLLLGGVAGVGLAVAQGLAAPHAPLVGIVLHSVALALAGALVLTGIRRVKGQPLPRALLYGAAVALGMTVVIGVVDYGYQILWP